MTTLLPPARREPRTTTPVRLPSAEPPRRRRLKDVTGGGVRNLVGAAVAAVCVTLLLFGRIAPFSGSIGFVVVAYVVFLATYALMVRLNDDGEVMRVRVMTVAMYTAGAVFVFALGDIMFFTVAKGYHAFFRANFFTKDLRRTGVKAPLSVGGVEHAIVGSLWIISIALVICVPLGLLTAVYLNEVGGRLARFVRTIVEAMTALPSIIAGLFVFATYILLLHFEKSGMAAAFAISCDMLPIIIRASDIHLRLVPGNLREASAALGAPQWRTVWRVVLPTARSGLASAVILGMARGMGETAPVLLTAGYGPGLNTNPVHGPMVSLPLATLELVKSGEPLLQARGYAAALLLLLLVTALFIVARLIGGRGPGQVSQSKARRIRRMSLRDAQRIIRSYGPPSPVDAVPPPPSDQGVALS